MAHLFAVELVHEFCPSELKINCCPFGNKVLMQTTPSSTHGFLFPLRFCFDFPLFLCLSFFYLSVLRCVSVFLFYCLSLFLSFFFLLPFYVKVSLFLSVLLSLSPIYFYLDLCPLSLSFLNLYLSRSLSYHYRSVLTFLSVCLSMLLSLSLPL